MDTDSLRKAMEELQRSVEALRSDLRAKDAELERLRSALADREARLRGMSEQALHLLDLLHESRAANLPKETK